jgi:hypothetical protein
MVLPMLYMLNMGRLGGPRVHSAGTVCLVYLVQLASPHTLHVKYGPAGGSTGTLHRYSLLRYSVRSLTLGVQLALPILGAIA